MYIFLFCSETSERARQFEIFASAKAQQTHRLDPHASWPPLDEPPLGAVFFDDGSPRLIERIRASREFVRYLSIPFVVVTREEKPDAQTALRNAGADFVCDPGTPDALLYKELHARCRVQPLEPETCNDLLGPFTTAVSQVLFDMADLRAVVRLAYQGEDAAALGDASAFLSLGPPLEGVMMMSFTQATAESLARRVLSEVPSEFKATLVHDCMGEITNVIAGQAKALFAGTRYHAAFFAQLVSLQTPRTRLRNSANRMTIAFTSDVGGFALQLCRNR